MSTKSSHTMSPKESLSNYEKAVKLLLLCLIWYVVSSVMGVVGKMILNDFPYPITVTMVQLISVIFYLIPFMKNVKTRPPFFPLNLAKLFWLQMLLPLALGKFMSSAFSHISIWKTPVSYVHTVKATLPLFTVFLSRVVMREIQTYKIYCSLVPIICGVVIASLTEISFDLYGLLSALLSTIAIALQNIYSKKCLKEHPLHHFTLLFTLVTIAATLFLPLWFYWDFQAIYSDVNLIHSHKTPRLLWLLLLDGFCYFSQNVIAFTIIAMVSPLSYAVANCTKRIAIISVSLVVMANPITPYNALGMLIAIFGVMCYKKAKYDQYHAVKPVLPTYNSNNNILLKQNLLHSNGSYSNVANNHFVDSNGSYSNGSYSNGSNNNGSYSNGMVVVPTDSLVNRYHSDQPSAVNLRIPNKHIIDL